MKPDDDGKLSRRDLLRRSAAVTALGMLGLEPEAWAAEAPPAGGLTPAQALQRLLDGNQRFAKGKVMAPDRELARVKQLASKQTPFAAVLGCADSRVPVEIVFDQGFGDLFVVRVAGNIATSVEIASLEYGALVLGASVILVLGHSNCGAVKAALSGAEVPGQISALFQYMVPAVRRGGMDVDAAGRDNVRLQAQKLREGSPVIAGLLAAGKVALAGGFYDLDTGLVSTVEI